MVCEACEKKGKLGMVGTKLNQSRFREFWLRIRLDFGRLYSDPDLGGQKLSTNTENSAEI
jgi:hypothetical protein